LAIEVLDEFTRVKVGQADSLNWQITILLTVEEVAQDMVDDTPDEVGNPGQAALLNVNPRLAGSLTLRVMSRRGKHVTVVYVPSTLLSID
jgi:hypothetical protein